MTVTTGRDGKGRDGTVKPSSKMEPWFRPVPSTILPTANSCRAVWSRKYLPLHFTVPSRRGNFPLPSRPVVKTCPYRPVPSTKLPLPSRPVKTCPYRPVPPSKTVPTVKSCGQNLSHGIFPPFFAVTPSCQDAVTVKMS